jgi:CheY-like chemotaxis protein
MARILVTDDEPCFLRILDRVLSDAGHQVVLAGTGREAQRQLDCEGDFDLLLTDIFMPEGDGLELIQSVRRSYPALPVIAMSGGGLNGKLDYLSYAHHFGADALLRKPFSMGKLTAEIGRLAG